MDRVKTEVMIYGHCCPQCYPERVGMVRSVGNVDVLECEICGFEIDDTLLAVPYMSLEEVARNYLNLIKQVLLNTKSDFHKYTRLKNEDGRESRIAKRELKRIKWWIRDSKLLGILANLANLDVGHFKERVETEMKTKTRYRWSFLFQKFTGVNPE